MRAMSLGLIKGSMDEVEQTINISWVQPRVLDKGQLSVLSAQLDTWSERCVTMISDFPVLDYRPTTFHSNNDPFHTTICEMIFLVPQSQERASYNRGSDTGTFCLSSRP
jgi:hypothetical protein